MTDIKTDGTVIFSMPCRAEFFLRLKIDVLRKLLQYELTFVYLDNVIVSCTFR
jgi:hypothetical protein